MFRVLGYIKKLVILGVIFWTVLFVLFVINETSQVVNLAANVHPLFGQFALFALLTVYATAVVIPLAAILKRLAVLFPPEDTGGEAYRVFIEKAGSKAKKEPRKAREKHGDRVPASVQML